jgi:Na+/glutamate symporter
MPGSVEEIGLSLVILSLVFACSALIRRCSRPLRKLFIPTAVIGGFLRQLSAYSVGKLYTNPTGNVVSGVDASFRSKI